MTLDPSQQARIQAERDAAEIALGRQLRLDVQTEGGQKLVQLMEARIGDWLVDLCSHDLSRDEVIHRVHQIRGVSAVLQDIGYNLRRCSGLAAKAIKRHGLSED